MPNEEDAGHSPVVEPVRESEAPASTLKTAPAPPRTDRLPPFDVLLHNDDVNSMDFVTRALTEVTPLTLNAAKRVMIEAHLRSAAIVMTTHLERAELYRDRLRSKGLSATVRKSV